MLASDVVQLSLACFSSFATLPLTRRGIVCSALAFHLSFQTTVAATGDLHVSLDFKLGHWQMESQQVSKRLNWGLYLATGLSGCTIVMVPIEKGRVHD